MKIKKHLNFSSLRSFVSSVFIALPDPRQAKKIKYKMHDVMMSAFACMHFQDKSFLQFKKRIEEVLLPGNLRNLFGIQDIPDPSQIREGLDQVDSEEVRPGMAQTGLKPHDIPL